VPSGVVPSKPVQLEFEAPSRASYPVQPELMPVLDLAEYGTSEQEQLSALENLVSVFQQQTDEFEHGQRQQIDSLLYQFITRRALRALARMDPAAAVKFLAGREPGKRAKPATAERDWRITNKVLALREADKTLTVDAAAEIVSKRQRRSGERLSPDRIKAIYKKHQRKARILRTM
jgi:hypothetical protein